MSGRPRMPEAERARIMAEVERRVASSDAPKYRTLADLAREHCLSVRQLRRWLAKGLGVDLADGRVHNGRLSRLEREPEVRDALFGYLINNKRLTGSHACELLTAQFPEPHRRCRFTPRTCGRWLRHLRQVEAYTLALHWDPDGHRSKYGVAFGRADEAVTRLNQLWEIDSSPTDLLLQGPDGRVRRYVVVAVIDVFTRRAMVLIAETSCAAAVAALIRKAVLAWGAPEKIRHDCGLDYLSHHVARFLAALDVEQEVCDPYAPQQKGFIERFFRTLQSWFELLPGYIGHSVAERQEIRSRHSFAGRRGQGDRAAVEIALTVEDMQTLGDAFCENDYGRRMHSVIGMSPFDKANAWSGPVSRVENERALDILLFESVVSGPRRTVSKKGIRADGALYLPQDYIAPGTAVDVFRDPADRGHVLVKGADGGFLCWAVCPERLGEDRQTYARRMKVEERARKTELRREGKRLMAAADPAALVDKIAANAAAEADKVVAFPRPAEAHETPALAESARADAARPADARPPAGARVQSLDRAAVNDVWERLIARRKERERGNG